MSMATGRRARKKRESRERIVDCAAKLFAERGYDSTSMEDIGGCADVSRATVFNYFPRKEDLVLVWFDSKRKQVALRLSNGDERTGRETSSRLRDAFRAIAEVFEEDPKGGRGMVRAWLQAGGPLLTPNSQTTGLFADIVQRGVRQGDVEEGVDPDGAGRLLFDAYLGVLYRWVTAEGENVDLESSLLEVLELLVKGIVSKPTAI